ncbi:MAG: hypothetical protein RLZZ306_43 [Bacteroidota bacterium]|jgi:hypothetical protein
MSGKNIGEMEDWRQEKGVYNLKFNSFMFLTLYQSIFRLNLCNKYLSDS